MFFVFFNAHFWPIHVFFQGPCFFIDGGTFSGIDASSKAPELYHAMGKRVKPKAILVISAHWEAGNDETLYVVGSQDKPVKLLYDYYGFPKHTYELEWKTNGSAELTQNIIGLLKDVGITVKADDDRGFDHGVFIPLKLAFPSAGIPTVQLSISPSLSINVHAKIGAALSSLSKQGILIVGSGQMTHGRGAGAPSYAKEHEFANVVNKLLHQDKQSFIETHERFPELFKLCHGRPEHWIPLVVARCAVPDDVTNDDQSIQALKTMDIWWNHLALISYELSTN